MATKSWIAGKVNSGLRPLGVQVVNGRTADPAVGSYISARSTLAAARRAGVSVGDFIDQTYAEPGVTAATVDAMLRLAAFDGPVDRICEIGAGSGRFLERLQADLSPQTYEVYETAHDWLHHLRSLPGVQVQPCDGHTLAATPDGSVDLVHAQKVFVYLPFSATIGYLAEMARVARPGGVVAFDVATEDCLDEDTVSEWIATRSFFQPMPKQWTLDFLARRGLTYLGSHYSPMKPGTAELMAFRRQSPCRSSP